VHRGEELLGTALFLSPLFFLAEKNVKKKNVFFSVGQAQRESGQGNATNLATPQ
jgi:hypothetical protein